MNDTYIVTALVVIDDLLQACNYQEDCRTQSNAAEILTVAVVAAKYFQNHHERALCLLSQLGYVRHLSVSRFNRRLHALRDWLFGVLTVLQEVLTYRDVFLNDTMPLPVCKRTRASLSQSAGQRLLWRLCCQAGTLFRLAPAFDLHARRCPGGL